MKNKKIPTKNYIIMLFITIVTIFLVFYLVSWYNASKEYYQNNSIMSNYLSEIKDTELSSYLIDNPDKVIYYASGRDESIKNFEKEFKKMIEKYEIKDQVIYVDAAKEENSKFVNNLSELNSKKITFNDGNNLFCIKEGKIDKVLFESNHELNKRQVRNFLIKCGVITND